MMTQQEAIKTLAQYVAKDAPVAQPRKPHIARFARDEFYVAETRSTINLEPHQVSVLNVLLYNKIRNFPTKIYSTIKKGGKTTVAGLVARYTAQYSGHHAEVLCLATDEEQARGRIYQKVEESIKTDPRFIANRSEIPGVWRIIQRGIFHIPTNSILRAPSNDYRGEAGGNPNASVWSELWSLKSESDIRFWNELTPPPTRKDAFRFVETYAGYIGESPVLEDLYKQAVKEGYRLSHEDMIPYGGWPFEDQPPIYVNETSGIIAFWDEGEIARRMPWLQGESGRLYYSDQASSLRPTEFERFHKNNWTSGVEHFIPIEWWDRLVTSIKPLDRRTPCVMAVDASVVGDCTGALTVSRSKKDPNHNVAVNAVQKWVPSKGHSLNYGQTIKPYVLDFHKTHNLVEMTYDPYQMHAMAQELREEGVNCVPFDQNSLRLKADKQLFDFIRDMRIEHNGDPDLREHIENCSSKKAIGEDTKLRIVKRSQSLKIDLAVCLSMATYECMRLLL